MTYGLMVKNDSSYIQIDSDSPRLCAVYSGAYLPSGRFSYVTFPAPITTQEPPCIFIRNSPAYPEHLYDSMTINGGAGYWTGFTLRTNNINWTPTGKWFAAVFAAKATEDYGMRIWDAGGALVYDSGTVPVIFTRSSNYWTYQGTITDSTQGTGGAWANQAGGGPLLSDEYFMINPFSRGVMVSHINAASSGVRFNWSGNYVQLYAFSAISRWTNPGNPGVVFARLPGT